MRRKEQRGGRCNKEGGATRREEQQGGRSNKEEGATRRGGRSNEEVGSRKKFKNEKRKKNESLFFIPSLVGLSSVHKNQGKLMLILQMRP